MAIGQSLREVIEQFPHAEVMQFRKASCTAVLKLGSDVDQTHILPKARVERSLGGQTLEGSAEPGHQLVYRDDGNQVGTLPGVTTATRSARSQA
jgi:hypothetical protein